MLARCHPLIKSAALSGVDGSASGRRQAGCGKHTVIRRLQGSCGMAEVFKLTCQSNRVSITTLIDQINGEHRPSQGTAAGKRLAGSREQSFETQILT